MVILQHWKTQPILQSRHIMHLSHCNSLYFVRLEIFYIQPSLTHGLTVRAQQIIPQAQEQESDTLNKPSNLMNIIIPYSFSDSQ
jgi:hypothetical protein